MINPKKTAWLVVSIVLLCIATVALAYKSYEIAYNYGWFTFLTALAAIAFCFYCILNVLVDRIDILDDGEQDE